MCVWLSKVVHGDGVDDDGGGGGGTEVLVPQITGVLYVNWCSTRTADLYTDLSHQVSRFYV